MPIDLTALAPLMPYSFFGRGSRLVSPVLGMWTAMITVLVGALLCFHIYLLAKGQTTNEYLRGEKRRGNIPHRSFVPNCRELWCGTQPTRSARLLSGVRRVCVYGNSMRHVEWMFRREFSGSWQLYGVYGLTAVMPCDCSLSKICGGRILLAVRR